MNTKSLNDKKFNIKLSIFIYCIVILFHIIPFSMRTIKEMQIPKEKRAIISFKGKLKITKLNGEKFRFFSPKKIIVEEGNHKLDLEYSEGNTTFSGTENISLIAGDRYYYFVQIKKAGTDLSTHAILDMAEGELSEINLNVILFYLITTVILLYLIINQTTKINTIKKINELISDGAYGIVTVAKNLTIKKVNNLTISTHTIDLPTGTHELLINFYEKTGKKSRSATIPVTVIIRNGQKIHYDYDLSGDKITIFDTYDTQNDILSYNNPSEQ